MLFNLSTHLFECDCAHSDIKDSFLKIHADGITFQSSEETGNSDGKMGIALINYQINGFKGLARGTCMYIPAIGRFKAVAISK